MKYMLIMRATDAAVEASRKIPFEQIVELMGKYNESMMQAGVLVAGEGLSDADEGSTNARERACCWQGIRARSRPGPQLMVAYSRAATTTADPHAGSCVNWVGSWPQQVHTRASGRPRGPLRDEALVEPVPPDWSANPCSRRAPTAVNAPRTTISRSGISTRSHVEERLARDFLWWGVGGALST